MPNCGFKLRIAPGEQRSAVPFRFNIRNHSAAFDQDAALAEKNRRAFFDRVVRNGAIVTGYHWGMPGAGQIKKDGTGYALVPVKAV